MPSQTDLFASVAIDLAINKPLDYSIPPHLTDVVKTGVHVEVPLRGRLRKGVVIEIKHTRSFPKILPIHSVISEEALLTPDLLELGRWICRYYAAPPGQVLKMMLPPMIRDGGGHHEPFYVKREASQEKLREVCIALREKHPAQAKALDLLLMAPNKGLLLSEMVEKGVSRSPLDSLQKKGFISIERVRLDRSPLTHVEYFKTNPKELNGAQREAYIQIIDALEKKYFQTHLLFGVTGSGKTEVYLQTIAFALQRGLSALMLIPEISLTAQTIERFYSRFDHQIAVLHHRLSAGERYDEWHRIKRGEAKIVVGARSALFSPLQNLGLIIVDEEHEGAYKQSEEPPCYNARDMAVLRGKLANAVVILGSATPNLESYFNAQKGKYFLNSLPNRTSKAELPKVHIVDMRREHEKKSGFNLLSELLIEKMKKRIELGEQTILFLNRRGYHSSLHCKGCGYIFVCEACDIALTFHRGENKLACHLCDRVITPPPSRCPKCRNQEMLKFKGVGTEQVERAVHALFPQARVLRIDGDTTRHKGSHEKLLKLFNTQKAEILIGTQMIAKGLHFPAVTLVAALNCDAALHIPDFRSSERVFQQMTQVAGRSGRGELAGEVIFQTSMPENPIIQHAATQNFEAFYNMEIESRKLFQFPPFAHLIKLTFCGENSAAVLEQAEKRRQCIAEILGPNYLVHPVVPSGYPKIKNIFRFQCLLRGPNVYEMNQAHELVLKHHPLPRAIRLLVDVDPLSTFY